MGWVGRSVRLLSALSPLQELSKYVLKVKFARDRIEERLDLLVSTTINAKESKFQNYVTTNLQPGRIIKRSESFRKYEAFRYACHIFAYFAETYMIAAQEKIVSTNKERKEHYDIGLDD